MATMNVSLPVAMVEFIDSMVSSGGYSSSSEVVREALRLLREERSIAEQRAAILRREVAIGLDQVESGQFSEKTISEISASVLAGATPR